MTKTKLTLAALVAGIPLVFGGCASTGSKLTQPVECAVVQTVGFEHGKLELGCKTQRGIYATYILGSDNKWNEETPRYVMHKPVYIMYQEVKSNGGK